MGHTPKDRCPECRKRFTLEWKGMSWVIPSHNVRIRGVVNPECKGTGKKI